METWGNAQIVGFDLETTGVDPRKARIVSAALVPAGTIRPGRSWLLDPGVEIPDDATRIHGISTEHAARHGQDAAHGVADIADTLLAAWAEGNVIAGHNIGYDLTVLDREMSRHLGRRLGVTGLVVDTLLLDRIAEPGRRGRRTLAACAGHWGVPAGKAHDAGGDAATAAALAARLSGVTPPACPAPLSEWPHQMLVGAQREKHDELQAAGAARGWAPEWGWPIHTGRRA